MNSAALKIITSLENNDPDFTWLLKGYKEALKAKAIQKCKTSFVNEDCAEIIEHIAAAGSPIQSWYFASTVEQFPHQATFKDLGEYIRSEIVNLQNRKIVSGDFEPAWAKAYFIDDPKMFAMTPPCLAKRDITIAQLCLDAGVSVLDKIWPVAKVEFENCIARMAFFDGVNTYSGGSTPRSFGVIYQSVHDQDSVTYANMLVHEVGHHLLNIFRSIDPITFSKPDLPLFSPLRNTVRPAWGVLHSAFSMTRMLQFCDLAKRDLNGFELSKANELYDFFLERQIPTLKILERLEWSDFGMRLFGYMCNQLETLRRRS